MTDAAAEGRAALAALDRALATRPAKDMDDFTEALEHLCAMRDGMIAAGERGERLGDVNALISATLSGRFPLGKVSWALIEAARARLDSLLR